VTGLERHAHRLLRCYPRIWRERYGDEFAGLLIDDLAERPRSLRRDLDVVRAGLGARIAAYGLARGPVQDRSALRVVAAAASVIFVAAVLSIWTQLADGWLAAGPESGLVRVGLITLSIWLGGLLLAATAFGVRVAISVVRAVRAGRAAAALPPMSLLVTSAAVLVAGVRLMTPMWPGAHLQHEGALAHVARVGWASTATISTFWLQPHRLLTLPAGELAWMLLCPAAVVAFVWSAARVTQVCSAHVPRAGGRVSIIGGVAVMPSLVTAAAWVFGSQHASNATYRAGTLDLVLIAAMLASALLARNALTADAAHPS
jgi:hypothetical protein